MKPERRSAWKPAANAHLRPAPGRLVAALLTRPQVSRRCSLLASPARLATARSRDGSKRIGAPLLPIAVAIAAYSAGLEASAIAAGPDAPVEPKVAIQRAKFQMAHELSLSFGVMPLDPFQKGICGSLSYTIHFSRYFAWELLRGTAAHLTSTSLRNQLLDTFAVSPDDFNAPRFMATTGFELSPIYGKQVFLNDTVVHQGLFLGLYGGVIFGDRRDNRTGDWLYSSTLSDLRPAAGGGIGYRLFLTKAVSLRIDVRDFISFRRAITDRDKTQLENVLFLGGGIAFNFWRDDA